MCLIARYIAMSIFSLHSASSAWMIYVIATGEAVEKVHVPLHTIGVGVLGSPLLVVVLLASIPLLVGALLLIVIRNVGRYMPVAHIVVAFFRFLALPRTSALPRVLRPLLLLRLLLLPPLLLCWWGVGVGMLPAAASNMRLVDA